METESLLTFYVRLTDRQQEVVELASTNLSNADIARRLHVESSVIAEHLTNIYERLHTLDAYPLEGRPNRYVIIRLFTLFFDRNPHLRQFEDVPTLL